MAPLNGGGECSQDIIDSYMCSVSQSLSGHQNFTTMSGIQEFSLRTADSTRYDTRHKEQSSWATLNTRVSSPTPLFNILKHQITTEQYDNAADIYIERAALVAATDDFVEISKIFIDIILTSSTITFEFFRVDIVLNVDVTLGYASVFILRKEE